MSRRFVAAGVFVIALGAYLITLAPGVGMTDSGELMLAAETFGVAHPPGFPLYVVVTHFFPNANIASAIFAALAAGVMAFVAGEAALLLAFSRTLWAYATIAEVYALNTFLCVAMLACAVAWRRTR